MPRKKNINWLTEKPIAHRALHDLNAGRVENSLGAAKAAMEKGFPIEVDLQFAKDNVPVVFHDITLGRLTNATGGTRKKNALELQQITLGKTQDHIPTLAELLDLISGKVGIIIEIKGVKGMDDGFVASVLKTLQSYNGNIAIMSFDHWLIDDLIALECPYPVGLVAEGKTDFSEHEKMLSKGGVDFISYGINDLPNAFISQQREKGMPVICWTVKDEKTAEKAYKYTDQITFEGFDPVPGN